MHDLLIVGGGFAGIYAAWCCARAGMKVALIERADHIGGTLNSVEKLGYLVDIGAHHLDLRTPGSAAFYEDILGGDLRVLQDHGWASTTGGKMTPGLEAPDFSTSDTGLCALALAELADVNPDNPQPDALPDWLVWKFGPTLGSRLGQLVAKVVGGPIDALDRDAAASLGMFNRIKLGSDEAMVALKSGSSKMDARLAVSLDCRDPRFHGKSSVLRFGYPDKGALRALCLAAQDRLRELGVDLRLGTTVGSIRATLEWVDLDTTTGHLSAANLLWTLPDTSLLQLLGLANSGLNVSQPVGAAIHVFEVMEADILGPSYTHDFALDRVSFRYARAGTYSRQVRPDGRSFVLSEIPCHPKDIGTASAMRDVVWRDLQVSGYLRSGAVALAHDVIAYPVAYTLPRLGWQPLVQAEATAIARHSQRILNIPFGHRGRDSFMAYFDTYLLPRLQGAAG
jgi:hypothetical protein